MFWEDKTVVSDARIPAGYTVTYHVNRGYDSPDRWYEAHEGKRKLGGYSFKNDAIEACVKDAENRECRKTRYELALENDAPEPI